MNNTENNLRLLKLSDSYFSEFESNQRAMAASPISLFYCIDVVRRNNLKTILDAGSGLSSLLFHDQLENVRTIDDNVIWRTKSSELVLKLLNKRISISDINEVSESLFDFVFYDYGNIETRIFYFKKALALTKKYMYIDDMHIDFYQNYIKSRAKPFAYKIIEETTDEFGRFGALLSK